MLPGLPFTLRHLMVLAVVLLVGAVLTGYLLTRARAVQVAAPVPVQTVGGQPGPGPAQPVPSATRPSAVPPGASTPVPSAAAAIRIHVLGAVRRPGVQKVSTGARVIDAVEAAGGLTPDARTGDLNLAQVLADGQQVVIGNQQKPGGQVRGGEQPTAGAPSAPTAPGGQGAQGSQQPSGGKVNLNSATTAQLDALPGVGPVTAEKIVAWRTQHGRFSRVEELQEVPGIGPKSFADLAPHVTV